jgi:hypothetical protein
MSLTAPELTEWERRFHDADGPWVSPVRDTRDDSIVVTCAACGTRQHASGRSSGYTCESCDTEWRVLRCPGCSKASIVPKGTSACGHCGHDHRAENADARLPARRWLVEPDPLSVWLGGVKYLGGHAVRDQPMTTAGLLLDRRGIHLRAFAEVLSISWDTVRSMGIEGPLDISERLTMSHLLAAGATTWAMQVAYLTVHTAHGDAVFEVDGLGPPELHARLSRVLQGLERSELPSTPIPLERGPSRTAEHHEPPAAPDRAPAAAPPEVPHEPVEIDPATSDAAVEILVVDALWKLAQLRDRGMLDEVEAGELRARILARVPGVADPTTGTTPGPLLHV